MPTEKQLQRLISAAIKYADLSAKQIAHEEWRTKTLQEAANLARAGQQLYAEDKRKQVYHTVVIWDFTDIKKELIAAVKPFKK